MEKSPALTAHLPFAEEEIEGSLPARFARVADACADKTAICHGRLAMTYSQLDQASDQIARAIIDQGGREAEPVTLLLGHELTAIPAILGVLKAGKFYVAMDLASPRARQMEIIRDARARLIVTRRQHEAAAAELAREGGRILYVDEIEAAVSDARLHHCILPTASMGLFYTSGSTGRPKGIEISHRYVLRYAWAVRQSGHLSPADRQALLFFSGFAAGLGAIFSTLLNGATLCLFDIHKNNSLQLVQWLEQEQISFLYPPLSLFRELLDALGSGANLPSLRLIYLAGQTVHKRDVERFKEMFSPECTLLLGFSSTEAGAITESPIRHHTSLTGPVIPVGFPVAGVEVLLYDTARRLAGPHQVGEIAVRSRYMASGYWQEPLLTGQKFLPDPEGGDRRIFLTGDLGRLNQDGSLELVGRKDFQAKIRGYRIELGEIEAALFALDCVKQAVVIDREHPGGEKFLAAYLIPASEAVPTSEELRFKLSKILPSYMIPSAFVFVDHFPLTPTGKIQRSALPPPVSIRVEPAADTKPAKDPLERQLTRIWENVLGVHPIGVEDNFFDLGGHSLQAMRLFGRIQARYGKSLSVDTVFQLPTIRLMAEFLRDSDGARQMPSLTPIQPRGEKPPLFCVHADRGTTYFYRRLTLQLGADQPIFGLQARDCHAVLQPPVTIEKMAAAYVQEIQARYPAGPCLIAGYSFGGKIALEMARLLRKEGREIGLLALIDTRFYVPNLGVRLRLFFRKLLNLSWRQKLRFIHLNLRGALNKLIHPYRPGLDKARKKRARSPRQKRPNIQLIHRIAAKRYQPDPYDGPVTYFIANDPFSPAYHQVQQQLGPWAKGMVRVVEIDCDHRGLIIEPGVKVLADKLGECIQRGHDLS